METTYDYLMSSFPNNKADLTRLTREIRQSPISSAELVYINYEPNNRVWVVFSDPLSSPDHTALNILIQNHSGDPIIYQEGMYAESLSESVTSSDQYINKLVLQPGELRAGKYKIYFYCEVSNTNTSGITQVRVCDGADRCFANPSVESEDIDDWIPFCGFTVVDVDDNYVVDEIKLTYRRQKKGSAKIRNARVQLSIVEMI